MQASSLKAKRHRKPRANEPKMELACFLERICGVDLTRVVGLNVLSVLLIVSEIGVDMSKWRSAKAFCSWLGLCPGNKISGGKVLDSPHPPSGQSGSQRLTNGCSIGRAYGDLLGHLLPA